MAVILNFIILIIWNNKNIKFANKVIIIDLKLFIIL